MEQPLLTQFQSYMDVDGGLVGGASLKSREFTEIVKSI
jgi:triosephosphate isomerase